MNERFGGWGLCRVVLATVVAWAAAGLGAAEPVYIHEDATIGGQKLHAFPDEADNVTVVLGGFQLTVGRRVISGRDAVLWIRTYRAGNALRHEITAYIEGDAKVVEPDGATTTDRKMLVTVRCQGRLTTPIRVSKGALKDFPLYQRAKAAREASVSPAAAAKGPKEPIRRPPPELRVKEGPPSTKPAPPATKAATKPTVEPEPKKRIKRKGPPQPVSLSAGSLSSERKGDRRVTIARNKVYLSQGNPDSDLFLELRSQEAVIFSTPGDAGTKAPPKDTRSPFSPRLGGAGVPGGGRETVSGVYLEGDVRISRGERTMSGSVAYYDFTTDRAIVLDPVFRSVQESRQVPVYVRATEARMLSAREAWFRDAKVSTSDFHTPTYHVGATRIYMMDTTPYDEEGVRLGEYGWRAKMKHTTFNVRGLPLLYWPWTQADVEDASSPLRRLQVSRDSDFGVGVDTEWHLFRLLGLVKPRGFSGKFSFDLYEQRVAAGVDVKYVRESFSGYSRIFGIADQNRSDDFGDKVRNVDAPPSRGRVLLRHKQLLPRDWQLQFESNEFLAGKEQETLLYAKKQRDNWAAEALLKYRVNRFLDKTESVPDVGLHLIGEPLLGDRLTFFSESHAGAKRFRPANSRKVDDSDFFARLDTRQEVDWPIALGPVKVVPYAIGRATYWGDTPDGDDECRLYGQAGLRATTHFWRVYNNIESRIWDLHRLKHVISPFAVAFLTSPVHDGALPPSLFPMDGDIEGLDAKQGVAVGLHQVLQTQRGPAGRRESVDWMRLALTYGCYDSATNTLPADGRLFWYRPENSLGRSHINLDYEWRISDATVFTAYANWDPHRDQFGRYGASLAVARNPRLRYLAGFRAVPDMDSCVGSFGVSYRISRKYTINAFEQYDFDYRGGSNLVSTCTITRKFPRWYGAFTIQYDHVDDDVTLILTFWPEGMPEFRVGETRLSVLGRSSRN